MNSDVYARISQTQRDWAKDYPGCYVLYLEHEAAQQVEVLANCPDLKVAQEELQRIRHERSLGDDDIGIEWVDPPLKQLESPLLLKLRSGGGQ